MSGMITTGDTNVSTYSGRTIAIEVTGICRQDVARSSNYRVKVPYSRMSQTIQNINRMGGKVAGVSLAATATVNDTASDEAIEEQPQEQPKKRFWERKNRDRQ